MPPEMPADDPMATILRIAARAWRNARRAQRNAPSRLTDIVRRHDSKVVSTNDATSNTPAFSTTMSGAPSASSITENAWSTDSSFVTSSSTPRTLSSLRRRRSPAAVRAPSAARVSAVRPPIPRSPPVTKATRPSRPENRMRVASATIAPLYAQASCESSARPVIIFTTSSPSSRRPPYHRRGGLGGALPRDPRVGTPDPVGE